MILDEPPPRGARPPVAVDSQALGSRVEQAWQRAEDFAEQGNHDACLIWMERAHRLAPSDQNLLFSLAMARLRAGRPEGSAVLFRRIAEAHGIREAWAGLAASSLAAGQVEAAVAAMASALGSNTADAGLLVLAARVAARATLLGWCALVADGVLRIGTAQRETVVKLDGQSTAARFDRDGSMTLPAAWERARTLTVTAGEVALLGSPIDLAAIRRVEGFADQTDDGIAGWAWHPASPERDPHITVLDGQGRLVAAFIATEISGAVQGTSPLARPRSFHVDGVPGQTLRVVGSTGLDLLGSPVATGARRIGVAGSGAQAPSATPLRRARTEVIIPAYRGLDATLACIHAALATVPDGTGIIVVDDASPEPALSAALSDVARDGRIRVVPSCSEHPSRNLGFPGAVNAGLREAAGSDVVLLNSDTLPAGDWLRILQDAAYSAPDIGTVSPLSNDATILSYPVTAAPNTMPDQAQAERLAAHAAEANAGRLVEIPTAHGFCVFIRHDCMAATGGLEEAMFAQGYGEENDFCERARALGWRHMAAPGAYVAHVGGASFGPARLHLLGRNLGVLDGLHPGYHPRIAAFMRADPLAPARRRLDAARWAGERCRGAVLVVTHGGGGGTARIVAERVAAIRARGLRPVVLAARDGLCCVSDGRAADQDTGFPNLHFRLPAELPALAALLGDDHPVEAELHHMLGHDRSVLRLFALFATPYDLWVHDYGWLCPRISLVTGEGRYCGEPHAGICEICVRRSGRAIEDPVSPTRLRARSARDLAGAARILVPSQDVARRLRRHFPGVAPVVAPWQQDVTLSARPPTPRHGRRLRVVVVGGIGVEKGYEVLLACARDAEERALDLEFVVVGYSIDDERLEATGRVFLTGPYSLDEAVGLIAAQHADIAFLPSIWPETWCYALSDAWEAGLRAAVFDIGTPPARVAATGRGWVLPLGLPAGMVNDALLRFANA